MSFGTEKTAKALEKVLSNKEELSQDEINQVKDFLIMTRSLGKIGKFLIWFILTCGAIAAVLQQFKMYVIGTLH